MKKFLLPLGAGVVVFGAATAFAATLTVHSSSLGAGNTDVNACNSQASVSYAPTANGASFDTGTATVTVTPDNPTTAPHPCGGMDFQVTLLDASNNALDTATGTFGATANTANATFTNAPDAASVEHVAVVITG